MAAPSQTEGVATSTLIRNTWEPNEDTYLAQLFFPAQYEAALLRLADAYPNEGPSVALDILQSDAHVVPSVKRNVGCDRPCGEIWLRIAPSDPMAILPERHRLPTDT